MAKLNLCKSAGNSYNLTNENPIEEKYEGNNIIDNDLKFSIKNKYSKKRSLSNRASATSDNSYISGAEKISTGGKLTNLINTNNLGNGDIGDESHNSSENRLDYEEIDIISKSLNHHLSRGIGDESVKALITQVSYSHLFTLLKNILTYLPFSINDYLIGTLELKEIIDSKYNTCFQLYKKDELMDYIYENEVINLVDDKVYNLFNKYKMVKNKKGPIDHLHVINFKENATNPSIEEILIEKSKIFIYKMNSFIAGRNKNLSYIYEICHGLKYKTDTFLLSVFIFDCYIHKINTITNKNHYKKIKLLVIICSILLALIKTQVFNGNSSSMYLNDILYFINKLKRDKVNYTCIEISNKQMEILKFLPSNYNNYCSYSDLTYVYFINLKSCSKKYPAIKIYYIFLEHFGFLYYIYDVIYAYSMYITAVGSYQLIPPSRIVSTIILYFSNAFYNRMSNSLLFQEKFCEEIFHLPFANDLFMWSYLFLDNFIYFFENCTFPNKHYSSIYSIFYETGRILNIRTVF
ncbi:conserved Plasmodium protein, unknown function [Plasmodium vinckei vinckei]|uniref:Uncharacterized protein n=1 Tax=Plasmodium vinckei vinckei TaxID=54757 RepID=A0A449BYN5_PLAVN|nr:conserved Plasmodium protein, unknown function [Plasmodium vinckei vinckei]KEG04828.1 hypothetical protein YYE_00403 [Plasmodium vinckei vinckei]VEV58482.1 conserved Plasmodium protein, unknown function [Plasmodium vinckei vinckei]